MKRFLLFAYDCYYPYGGWADFQSDHDTLEEAQAACWLPADPATGEDRVCKRDVVYIIDTETKEKVWEKP